MTLMAAFALFTFPLSLLPHKILPWESCTKMSLYIYCFITPRATRPTVNTEKVSLFTAQIHSLLIIALHVNYTRKKINASHDYYDGEEKLSFSYNKGHKVPSTLLPVSLSPS